MNIYPFSSVVKRVAMVIGFGLVAASAPAIAQQTNPQSSPYQENEYDAMGSSTFGNSFNPLDWVHRANLSNGPSSEEFSQESQQNLHNAADEFKRQQQERLNQLPSNPENER